MSGKPVPGVEPGTGVLTMYSNIISSEGMGHRVDNTVQASHTFVAPIMRQMETSSVIAPDTATAVPIPTTTVTDTHPNVTLAVGTLQKNTNLKLRNNVFSVIEELRLKKASSIENRNC